MPAELPPIMPFLTRYRMAAQIEKLHASVHRHARKTAGPGNIDMTVQPGTSTSQPKRNSGAMHKMKYRNQCTNLKAPNASAS